MLRQVTLGDIDFVTGDYLAGEYFWLIQFLGLSSHTHTHIYIYIYATHMLTSKKS